VQADDASLLLEADTELIGNVKALVLSLLGPWLHILHDVTGFDSLFEVLCRNGADTLSPEGVASALRLLVPATQAEKLDDLWNVLSGASGKESISFVEGVELGERLVAMVRALADAAVDFVLGFVKVTLDVLVRRFVNNLSASARGLSSALVSFSMQNAAQFLEDTDTPSSEARAALKAYVDLASRDHASTRVERYFSHAVAEKNVPTD